MYTINGKYFKRKIIETYHHAPNPSSVTKSFNDINSDLNTLNTEIASIKTSKATLESEINNLKYNLETSNTNLDNSQVVYDDIIQQIQDIDNDTTISEPEKITLKTNLNLNTASNNLHTLKNNVINLLQQLESKNNDLVNYMKIIRDNESKTMKVIDFISNL